MIVVQVRRTAGWPTGFTVSGHAGSGQRGSDIVCAAVSALTDTTVLGLERLAGVAARVKAEGGYLRCDLPEDLAEEARDRAALLIENMLLGFGEIARAYPGRLLVRDSRGKRGESHVPV
ncbi:MAG TPA: ribosomal-processing cysteine protease Prp [Firmicutes bacterium]|nr:ribosomal-processing cysteine protease Prp [Bacillota bacterium]